MVGGTTDVHVSMARYIFTLESVYSDSKAYTSRRSRSSIIIIIIVVVVVVVVFVVVIHNANIRLCACVSRFYQAAHSREFQ